MARLNLTLSPSLQAALDQAAEQMGLGRSETARSILAEGLAKRGCLGAKSQTRTIKAKTQAELDAEDDAEFRRLRALAFAPDPVHELCCSFHTADGHVLADCGDDVDSGRLPKGWRACCDRHRLNGPTSHHEECRNYDDQPRRN
jgi:hypothetical protein